MYCNISVITLFTREFHYIYIVYVISPAAPMRIRFTKIA